MICIIWACRQVWGNKVLMYNLLHTGLPVTNLALWKPTSSKRLSGGLSPRSEEGRERCQRWFLPSQGSRSLCRFLSVPSDERKSPLHSEYMAASWFFYVWKVSCGPHPTDCTQRIWDSHPVTEAVSRSRLFPEISFSDVFLHVSPRLAIICSTPHWH